MTPTSVGMRCPECAGEKTKVRRMRGSGPSRSFSGPAVWNDPRTWSVTQALIVVNVVIFLWEVLGGITLTGNSGSETGFAFSHGVLLGLPLTGHNPYPAPFNGNHEYWRLLTSAFLHESIFHVGINMFSLWMVGRALEPAIGKLYFAAIYFTGALAGSFGALAFEPRTPTLGASGAIFAVFGALIMVAHARRIPLWQSGLVPMLLLNLVFTLTVPGVAIGGHIGGLASGLATGWLVTEFGERRSRRSYVLAGCLLIVAVSVVGAILVAGDAGITPNGWNL
jgi:membrane associated rhomboid family serine protease